MLITALLFFIFLIISLAISLKDGGKVTSSLFERIRIWCFLAITILLLGYLFGDKIFVRIHNPEVAKIHDGAILTEAAYEAILAGKNPYSVSYQAFFEKDKYLGEIAPHAESHYTYSPTTFLVNIPFSAVTDILFKFKDSRVALLVFFLLVAFVGNLLVKEKLLFGMLFLLNPFFLPSVLFGANDVIPLFFLILTIAFLYHKKIVMATIMLGIATTTKLTVLPFVPLYFLYLFWKIAENERFKLLIKQAFLFVLINLTFYLPFLVWNFGNFIDDVLIYHLQGGVAGRPIAGFLGVPQLLTSFSFISQNSNFPFYLFSLLIGLISLPFFYYLFKKSLKLSILCVSFVIYFILIFSFSRILQTDYLAFLSQVLLFAGFVKDRKI